MTTQTKHGHTPGPWKLSGWIICRDKGIKYAIADVMTPAVLSDGEKEANGRLIAACPTMYDFIKKEADKNNKEAIDLLDSIN